MEGKKGCVGTLWLSGFFAFPALVHLVRLLGRFPFSVGGVSFRLRHSLAIVVVFGLLSAFLCRKATCGSGSSCETGKKS